MSEDLIRRSDAIKAVRECRAWHFCELVPLLSAIKDIPTIVPKRPEECWGCNCEKINPKRGEWKEWIDCEGEVFWKCSACGQASEASAAGILYKFCPFCGARMKGADDE